MKDIVTKDATVAPTGADTDFPGTFEVVLSAPTLDRDGEVLKSDEWKTPLPAKINFDTDHGMSVRSTVGSGVPRIDEKGNLVVSGTWSSLPYAQDVRTLVKEGHIDRTSVAYITDRTKGKDGTTHVVRELLNGAFVAIPANDDAIVLGVKSGARNNANDAATIQSIHDATRDLGAHCVGSSNDGGEGGKAFEAKAVSDKPWSDFTAADYDIDQWRKACLIGPATASDSKDDYKLPVREPDGTLNRAACHAAASVLAGGRGGVKAPPEDIKSAAKALVGLYRNQLKEDPPDSVLGLAGMKEAAWWLVSTKDADTTDDNDPMDLIAATDAAIDQVIDLLSAITDPSPEVQQALDLLQAADAAVDEAMELLGIDDPDEGGTNAKGAASAPATDAEKAATDADTKSASAAAEPTASAAGAPAGQAAADDPTDEELLAEAMAIKSMYINSLTGGVENND